MEPVRAPAGRGVAWVGDGWRAFTASPGMWIVLTVVWLLVLLALQLVPLVGALAAYLLAPALAGGLLLCADDARGGRALDLGRLFDPLTDPRSRNPILVLGVLFLVANLVALVAGAAVFMGTLGMTLFDHHAELMGPGGMRPEALDHQALLQLGAGAAMGGLLALALGLLVLALFYYAIPLVLFDGVEPATAIGRGVRGVLRNWLPLLVLSVLWLPLSLLASVPLMLGWLVLLPMTFGAWYGSYRDAFPGTAAAARADETPGQGAGEHDDTGSA